MIRWMQERRYLVVFVFSVAIIGVVGVFCGPEMVLMVGALLTPIWWAQ